MAHISRKLEMDWECESWHPNLGYWHPVGHFNCYHKHLPNYIIYYQAVRGLSWQ